MVRHIFCLALFLSLIAGPAHASERVALVIGNGNYVNAGALANPANDAQAVAAALRDVGFDVSLGRDLGRNAMEQMLRDFLRKADRAKVALLYFAGHGMQVDGRNYLVPVDAKIETPADLGFATVELDRILANLEDPARATIVILDACRDNPLSRSFAARSRSASVGTGLAAYSTLGTGTLIAFATAPGKVALDGAGRNSPFTESLVKHLRTPGLEVRAMLTRVRADVMAATRNAQLPWDNSSLMGDVFLAGPPQAGPAAAAIPVAPPPAALPPPAPPPAAQQPPAMAALPAPQRSADDGFIFPDSHLRRIHISELHGLSQDQLRIARNEIYARRGRFFRDQALAAYFSRFPWYRPTTWDVQLSAIEQANVKLIQSMEW
ncbi:caspase family protein [Pseudorhodoplanes sp.]|uniref:caspase family protein n=1 Tax=Pseudorhodoplanes sp. TaxID=1934341 RepID=UPI00391A80A8